MASQITQAFSLPLSLSTPFDYAPIRIPCPALASILKMALPTARNRLLHLPLAACLFPLGRSQIEARCLLPLGHANYVPLKIKFL